jgi:hypothetical protein
LGAYATGVASSSGTFRDPSSAPGEKKLNTLPWYSFEPDLVTTLRMPPVVRPNSGM